MERSIHIPASKGRPVEKFTPAKFSNELRVIACTILPGGTDFYKKIDTTQKENMYESVWDRFEVVDDGPHLQRRIDSLLSNRISYKSNFRPSETESFPDS